MTETNVWQRIARLQSLLEDAESRGDDQDAHSLLGEIQQLHKLRLKEERGYTPLHCPTCGEEPHWVVPHPLHGYGIFCSRCGRWTRWLGKGREE